MSDTPKQPEAADRLAKVMARAGLCSRRDAEGWITAGRVAVNGKKVLTPAFNVTSRDKISVDGLPLAARQGTRIWLYHKPAGLVVTEKDPEGRATIFDELDALGLPRVVTVGRLDINTEGLLLLTNDGGLKRVLELPSTGWLRRYRVRAYGSVTQAQLDGLKAGIEVEGVKYGPIEATLEREQGSNVWLVLGLREGKNREVKNVLGALGLEVNRLIRVSYGPFQLGELPVGRVEVVKARMLRDQLGKKLAEAAGVDFESEMPDALPGAEATPRGREERAPRTGMPTPRAAPRIDPREAAAGRRGGPGRDERPAPRPKTVHFDEDGRAPESFVPKGPGRPRRDPEDGPVSSFGKRPERDARPARGAGGPDRDERKPFAARGEGDRKPYPAARGEGGRPQRGRRPEGEGAGRPFRDGPRPPRRDDDRRPSRDFGDRPRPGFGDKPARPSFGKRPERDFSDKPKRDFGDRPKRDFGDRPARPFGDRPQRGPRPEFGARDEGRPASRGDGPRPARDGKPSNGRPFGAKPFAGKPGGGRPFAGKPGGRPEGGRPEGGRPAGGGRPFAGRPGGRPEGGRPEGGRPAGGGRPFAGKPGGRPEGGRPEGGRPAGGGRPFAGKPGGKPFARPGGSRPPSGGRPSGGRPPSGGPRKPRG